MPGTPPIKVRSQQDYTDLSRSVAANHFHTEMKKAEAKAEAPKESGEQKTSMERKLHLLKEFSTKTLWNWLKYYIINRFGRKADYLEYAGRDKGIYTINGNTGDPTLIGIAGDWATFTQESCNVAAKMGQHNPHYTVHIGDTYYVGEPKEIAANFLGDNCPWIKGSKGSFALLGNHEMYARGIAYYERLLPELGLKGTNGVYGGQGAAFFCLQNNHWRILGLDSGYHSIGKIPLLEMIPFLSPNCRFDPVLMRWLKEEVQLGNPADKRGIVVLTHHQYITAFKGEGEYTKPGEQLAQLIGQDKPIIWLFGHEHKFCIYDKAQAKKGVTAFCRCVGNGGMPIEIEKFKTDSGKKGYDKLVRIDDRQNAEGTGLGYNGYALLKIAGTELAIEYYDVNKLLVREAWHAENGAIQGRIDFVSDDLKTNKLTEGLQWL